MNTSDSVYTCLALSKRFIAFGATSGAIYIFQRDTNKYLQVLVNKEGPVSHVAFAPDDNLVGLSTNNGLVVIWQLNIANRKKPDLLITSFAHKGSCITCLKWNDTSQKLYSGDIKGKVTVTNAFSRKVSGLLQLPTSPIVSLDSAIVQLDFTKDYLLVSSLSKCHICNTKRQQFYSVGKKLRDGLYGACFYLKSKEGDAVIYSARPGSRLWEATLKGEVVATHQFKRQLAIPALPIISTDCDEQFIDAEDSQPPQAINFPFLLRLEHFLLTWNEKAIYILDTSTGKVVLWTRPPSGIQNLCVYKSDIYYIDNESQINKLSFLTIERCIVRLFIKQSWKLCASICHHFAEILTSIKTKRLVSVNILKDIKQHLSKQENTKDLIGCLDDVIYKMEQIITEETNSSSSSRRSSIESVDSIRLESGIYLIRSRRGSQESLEDLLSSPINHLTESSSKNDDAMKQDEQFTDIECSKSESDGNVANNNEQSNARSKESNPDNINILEEQEVVELSSEHRNCQSNGLDCEIDFQEDSLAKQILDSDSAGEANESELLTSHPAGNAVEVNELHTQVEVTVTHNGTECEFNSPDVDIDTDCQESATLDTNGGCVEDEMTTKNIEEDGIQLRCPEPAQNRNTLIENSDTNITMIEKQPVDITTVVQDKMSCDDDDDDTNPVVVLTPSVTEEAGVVNHELIVKYNKLEETDSFADGAYEPVMRRTESFTCSNSNDDRTIIRRSYSMSNANMLTEVSSNPKPSRKQSRHQNGKKKKKKSRVPEIGEVKPKKDNHKENIDGGQSSNGHILKPRPKDIIIPDKSPSVSNSPSPLFGKRFGLESPIFSRRGSPSPVDDVTPERKGLGQRQISVPFAAVKDSLSSTYSKTKEFVKAKLDQNKKSPNTEESGLISPAQLPSEEKLQNESLYAGDIVVKACDTHEIYSPFEEATISTRLKLQHPLILYDVSMCREVLDQWLTDLQAAYEKNSELKTDGKIVVQDNQLISDENKNLNDDEVTDSEKISDDMKEDPGIQIESVLASEDSSSISEELYVMADNFPLQDALHDHASELLMMCLEMQVFPESRQPDINEANATPTTSFNDGLSMQFCESNKESERKGTSVQDSEYSVPIIDRKTLDMQAANFVKHFFHFLDVNRIRKVMSSWTDCRQKTYNVLSRKLIGYFNGNRATSCQNTSCAAKMVQMQEQYKDIYRMLRLVIDSPDSSVESLIESKVDLRVWEIKEILQIFHPSKAQKLFGDYVSSRMQQESLSDRCNFTAELCDDSNVFNYLIQCIFNCNTVATKMAICTCGSPRSGSHNLAWEYQELLDTLLVHMATTKMAAICEQYGYWQGCLKLSDYLSRKTILDIIWCLGDINILQRKGLIPTSFDEWQYLLNQISRLEAFSKEAMSTGTSIKCYQCFTSNSETVSTPSLQNIAIDATNPEVELTVNSHSDWSTTITWENTVPLLAKSIGPQTAIDILGKFKIPKNKISPEFFQNCIMGIIINRNQRMVTHAMLEKVDSYLWSKRQHALPQQLKQFVKEEHKCRISGLRQPKEVTPHFKGTLSGRQHFLEEPLSHWGVNVNLKKDCLVCGLQVTSQVSKSTPGLLIFPCGHIFHSECIPERFCMVCFYSKKM
ncbi:Hermansky-Pudlak syndrome 5 protein-like [Anneissia japonica]|uniref:Hermansky-Pudlak syndrome 5 protein-like n=1 Tax=Anneissia japonica TaxID=1529436 RepID=UPI00142572FA|nr:Hermansky-Pudlak syndrome 5 protein-like [Anneissia japonica]